MARKADFLKTMDQNLELLRSTIKDFCERCLGVLRLTGEVIILEEEGVWWVKLETDDPGLLIGHRGEHILLLEHLVRRIANKAQSPTANAVEPIRIMIDINRYRKHRTEALREIAQQTADDVRFSKREFAFEPMPAYERRIIHTALGERLDVTTESMGEGPERRVVVKPAL